MTWAVARGGLLAGLAAVVLGGALLHAPAAQTTRAVWAITSHADAVPTVAPFAAERVEGMGAVMSALAGVTGSTTVSTGRPVGFVTLTDTHGDEPSPESRPAGAGAPRTISLGLRTQTIGAPVIPRTADGSDLSAAPPAATSQSGVNARAVASYRLAARLLGHDRPSCRLPWQLLAAVGRVESNHGAFGASSLLSDGLVAPPVIGIPLDGRPGIALIADSDGGVMDGDTRYDRAVGPMQFLPQTWQVFGGDADNDGRVDVHDLDDAAYGAGRLLCTAGDLSSEAGQRAAVFRYNPSLAYVAHVLSWFEIYRSGVEPVVTEAPQPDATRSSDPTSEASAVPSESPSPNRGATTSATTTPTPAPDPARTTPTPTAPPAPRPAATATPTAEATPAPTPVATPTPTATAPASPTPTQDSAPTPTPTLAPTPSPEPPSTSAATSAPSAGPTPG